MKIEGLTIICENTAEFMVLAEGVDQDARQAPPFRAVEDVKEYFST